MSALRAARIFEKDVAAIDINMGCAKHYAMSGGMGAKLMVDQKTAEDIIKTLRRNLSIPLSIKTRIFGKTSHNTTSQAVDVHKSCEWVSFLQKAGAGAIAIHSRLIHCCKVLMLLILSYYFKFSKENNNDKAHHEVYNVIYETLRITNTPLICNGDIFALNDVERIKKIVSGECQWNGEANISFMLGRAAVWDPSIFRTLKVWQFFIMFHQTCWRI